MLDLSVALAKWKFWLIKCSSSRFAVSLEHWELLQLCFSPALWKFCITFRKGFCMRSDEIFFQGKRYKYPLFIAFPWYLHGKIQSVPGKFYCTLEDPFKMHIDIFKNTFKLFKMYYTRKQKQRSSAILPVVFLPATRLKHQTCRSCQLLPLPSVMFVVTFMKETIPIACLC